MNYGRSALKKRARRIDAKPVKIRRKFGVILLKLLLVTILVTGCAGVSTVVGAVKGILSSAPDVSEMDVIPTGYSTTVLATFDYPDSAVPERLQHFNTIVCRTVVVA